mgnify:CR=1 FL=1
MLIEFEKELEFEFDWEFDWEEDEQERVKMKRDISGKDLGLNTKFIVKLVKLVVVVVEEEEEEEGGIEMVLEIGVNEISDNLMDLSLMLQLTFHFKFEFLFPSDAKSTLPVNLNFEDGLILFPDKEPTPITGEEDSTITTLMLDWQLLWSFEFWDLPVTVIV